MEQLIIVDENGLKKFISNLIKDSVREYFKEMPPFKQIYTRKEAKELLGVTYPTLNNWNRSGTLKAQRIGGKVFYTWESIKKAIT